MKSISAESSSEAEALGVKIAEEGIVLLQNNDNVLPLSDTNVNVFGWASAFPVYGGTGSGAMNDAYHIVDMMEGLANAGLTTNTDLTDFYKAYKADTLNGQRPGVGMFSQEKIPPNDRSHFSRPAPRSGHGRTARADGTQPPDAERPAEPLHRAL